MKKYKAKIPAGVQWLAATLVFILSAGHACSGETGGGKITALLEGAKGKPGWATGEWSFSMKYDEQTIGFMDVKIEKDGDDYRIVMDSGFEMGGRKHVVKGEGMMTERLGFLHSERMETTKEGEKETQTVVTGEVRGDILIVSVRENGREVEIKKIETGGELYMGFPALIPALKLLDLDTPGTYTFPVFSAENRGVVTMSLMLPGKPVETDAGEGKAKRYIVAAKNAQNTMHFILTGDGEVERFGPPRTSMAFVRTVE
ncbi:MAG: hypothetical protein AB1742_03460 [bacterium]